MASILEYEANSSEDYPKVARVLYNRPKRNAAAAGLDGLLRQRRSGDVWTTAAERSNTSLYNTYAPSRPASGPDRLTG